MSTGVGSAVRIRTGLGEVGGILVASPAYVARHTPIEGPSDLINHVFERVRTMFGAEHLPLIDPSAQRENVEIRTVTTTNHWKAMCQMIKDGLGIGVLDAFACADAIAAGKLVALLQPYRIPSPELHLLTRAQRPVPARVRTVAEVMKQYVPDMLGAQPGA